VALVHDIVPIFAVN